jgi:hypothetical protein
LKGGLKNAAKLRHWLLPLKFKSESTAVLTAERFKGAAAIDKRPLNDTNVLLLCSE